MTLADESADTGKPKTDRLRSMMRPYQSPRHTVVAFCAQQGTSEVIASGPKMPGTASEDVLFEIASITKVFTGILLCLLVEEGKIDPRAPLREMSGALSDVPDWITPERLTSHTSGLPNLFMPLWKALFHKNSHNPYAMFSRTDLLEWFRTWTGKPLGVRPRHAYSNLAVGLLGEAMAMQEGTPFSHLLANKVLIPLGLTDTTDRLTEDQQRRFAHPRTPGGKEVTPWTFQALAGAGCLRSTARDLSRFSHLVIRALNSPETTLDRAICRSAVPILGLGLRGRMEPMAQCSGWLSLQVQPSGPPFLFHNGGTAGSSCALYICPEKDASLAILSNNGVAGNLWAGTKLNWSNPHQQAQAHFAAV